MKTILLITLFTLLFLLTPSVTAPTACTTPEQPSLFLALWETETIGVPCSNPKQNCEPNFVCSKDGAATVCYEGEN